MIPELVAIQNSLCFPSATELTKLFPGPELSSNILYESVESNSVIPLDVQTQILDDESLYIFVIRFEERASDEVK